VDSDTIEMTSSTPHGGDVTNAMPAAVADDDSVHASPDSTVTASGEAAGDAIEAETAAPSICDQSDAVVAEDVPPVINVFPEQESSVEPRERCEVRLAEQAQKATNVS